MLCIHEQSLRIKTYVAYRFGNVFRNRIDNETTKAVFYMASEDTKWLKDNFGQEPDIGFPGEISNLPGIGFPGEISNLPGIGFPG